MIKLASILTTVALAAGVAAPAFAQDQAPTATLRVDQGSVMTSDGGEFASASTGSVLNVGERLMVTEGSVATVVYDNDCDRTYKTPGVYVVEDGSKCVPAAVAGEGVKDSTVATVVAVSMVLAPLLTDTDRNKSASPPPPVSR